MGFESVSNLIASISSVQDHITTRAVNYGERALTAVRQRAAQARDHFTHGNGHVLDNVLRNAGNDAVSVGMNSGASMGRGFGTAVGALFGGVGSIPGGNLGERAGRALGREVAGLMVDGGTAVIQDIASVTPGLSRRGGEQHIPNHNTFVERVLARGAEYAIKPFEAGFQAVGIYHPAHIPSRAEMDRIRANSVAVSLDNPEATAAHNARLTAQRQNQPI